MFILLVISKKQILWGELIAKKNSFGEADVVLGEISTLSGVLEK